MLRQRHTIAIATSALLLVCLMLHAQTSQTSALYDDSEAYRVYEALLPTDGTVTAAHARRLLIRTQTDHQNFCLKADPAETALQQSAWMLHPGLDSFFKPDGGAWKAHTDHYPDSAHSGITPDPVAFNAGKSVAVAYMGHSCGSPCGGGTFYVLEKEPENGLWKNKQWMGTSCAWAS
jgi:hypothetical protein